VGLSLHILTRATLVLRDCVLYADQGDLGEILIRCNNVLYVRKAEE
jgi:small nuclear ribonucleoprotein (snRNP)-like protein